MSERRQRLGYSAKYSSLIVLTFYVVDTQNVVTRTPRIELKNMQMNTLAV